MESSGEQALLIGVNVFILIIALTCAIMLMSTVLNISNAANTVIKTNTTSSLMPLYGETNERIYTGEQVLAEIAEYNSPTANSRNKMILKLKIGDKYEEVGNVVAFTKDRLDSDYHLRYDGKSGEKYVYIFEKIN